jgi:protein gp37
MSEERDDDVVKCAECDGSGYDPDMRDGKCMDCDGSWTHHTFNPWRGCTKVSAGCAHCYADKLSARNPKSLGIWGKNGTRVVAAESYWREPLKWDAAAKAAGERHRVFCASLADVFEGQDTMPAEAWSVVQEARKRLFDLVCRTPHLDWLMLTKRPENALRLMVEAGLYAVANPSLPCPQPNLWIGTSVEDQSAADSRIPHLLSTPAAVRFLSCEPLLGPIDIEVQSVITGNRGGLISVNGKIARIPGIDWAIVGGESGPGARPMHPDWARSLRDQCIAAGVAFHFKQWGEFAPGALHDGWTTVANDGSLKVNDPRLNVAQVTRIGKKAAGRMLDGRTWDQFPTPKEPTHA